MTPEEQTDIEQDIREHGFDVYFIEDTNYWIALWRRGTGESAIGKTAVAALRNLLLEIREDAISEPRDDA